MRQKEVKMWNVDDYIRERKRSGAKCIYWDKHALESAEAFIYASWPIEYGYKLPDTIHGLTYMGIKHYIRK